MAHRQLTSNRPVLVRVGSLVAASTLVLTFAFFGVLAFASGDAAGVGGRFPYYVLGAAATFAAALIGLDRRRRDGRNLLVVASAAALVAFVFITLGLEGIAYALRRPSDALASRKVLYLIAAALVSTGLGYWGLNHWREITEPIRQRPR